MSSKEGGLCRPTVLPFGIRRNKSAGWLLSSPPSPCLSQPSAFIWVVFSGIGKRIVFSVKSTLAHLPGKLRPCGPAPRHRGLEPCRLGSPVCAGVPGPAHPAGAHVSFPGRGVTRESSPPAAGSPHSSQVRQAGEGGLLGGPPAWGSRNQTLPLDTEGWRGEAGEERGTGTQRGGGQFLALGARGLLLGPLPQPMSLWGSLCSAPPIFSPLLTLLLCPGGSLGLCFLDGTSPLGHTRGHRASLPTVPPQPCQSRTSRKGPNPAPPPSVSFLPPSAAAELRHYPLQDAQLEKSLEALPQRAGLSLLPRCMHLLSHVPPPGMHRPPRVCSRRHALKPSLLVGVSAPEDGAESWPPCLSFFLAPHP